MKNVRRGIRMLLLVLAFLLLFYTAVNLYATGTASARQKELDQVASEPLFADAILVLGAGVRSDGSPSAMLEDRLLCAAALYEMGVSDAVIVSGDHGTPDYDEVNAMKRYLVEQGIPSDRIFMDHAGFSTYDSLYRARAIFGAESLVIVTQEYHTARALMIGRHLGIECSSVSAPIFAAGVARYGGQTWYSFRESIARCKDFFYCLIQPEPTCLGDPISLKGSGDATQG